LFRGFRRPFRDLYDFDVTNTTKDRFRTTIRNIMKYQGKNHFIAEYSGWSRIGFFNEIFSECKFIHIIRDGRAVANSLNDVFYWLGWEGIHKWRWGILPDDLFQIWERYNYSFLALAAIQWKVLINNIHEQSKNISSNRFLTIRYEDLVNNPVSIANQCVNFMGLDCGLKNFSNHLKKVKIIDANNETFRIPSWKQSLKKEHIDMLNDILREELDKFSYI
jgi:hypothetical protein